MKECRISLPLTHMSAIWLPCVFWTFKKKAAFQSKRKKESLIRLAAALGTKLLSADAPQLKLAWVMSSDALQYWENNTDEKINRWGGQKCWKVPKAYPRLLPFTLWPLTFILCSSHDHVAVDLCIVSSTSSAAVDRPTVTDRLIRPSLNLWLQQIQPFIYCLRK